jgi:microcystin-dependent protein
VATNFPTSLDTLTNPTSGSALNSPDHAGQHADANDAIEALEAKVGVNGSAVTTSLDYKVSVNSPPGMIVQYGGTSAPTGWVMCDGTPLLASAQPALFAVIGYTYGGSSGTFYTPDLRTRVPVGKNATGTFATLGGTGGVESVTLTSAQSGVPAHGHSGSSTGTVSHRHTAATGTNGVGVPFRGANPDSAGAAGWGSQLDGGASTGYWITFMPTQNESAHTHPVTVANSVATNAASAHTNLQPFIVLNYIIKT